MSKYYDIDEKDERLTEVEKQGNDMLSGYQADMDKALDANKSALDGINANLEKGQAALEKSANAQTEFAIDEIERQKAQAQKDYIKEQSAAYKDYQKQVDPYGVNAEKMAGAGLTDTGYAESSKVSMWNQYQTRFTVARESIQRTFDNFNAKIAEARMQNSATLAQIAYDTMIKQVEYELTFAMKNTELLTQMAGQKVAIKQQNRQNYMAVYQQLIQEAQYDASMAEQKRQFDANMAFQREQFNWQKAKAAAASSGGGGGSSSIKKSSGSSKKSSGSKKISTAKDIKSANKETATKKSRKAAEPTVDMQSVLALGYGPISASKLNSLVASGKVKEYEEGGKLKYKKVFSTGGGSGWAGGR